MEPIKPYLPDVGVTVVQPELPDRRRSGVQQIATLDDVPSVSDLRDRYVILLTAREYAPDRLSQEALHVFDAHQKVAMDYGSEDAEEIYSPTASGHLMRQRLREICPAWFEA